MSMAPGLQCLVPFTLLASFSTFMAAVTPVACSKDPEREDEKKTEPQPPKDVLYKRECIRNIGCSDLERIAAVEDYVATVYGGEDGYDGRLTGSERVSVEAAFGKLSSVREIPVYLSNARRLFFSPLNRLQRDYPCDERHALYQAANPELGEVHAIGGGHGCWEQYRDHFAVIELQIAAAPDDWLFILENHKPHSPVIPNPEDIYFDRMAKRLRIPVANTILSFEDPRVMSGLNEKGIEPMTVAFALAITPEFSTPEGIRLTMRARELAARGHPQAMPQLLDDLNKKIRFTYGRLPSPKPDFAELKSLVMRYALQLPEADQAVLAGKIESTVWAAYTEVSNLVSQEATRDAVSASGKKRVAVVCGFAHLPLFKAVYPNGR